MSEEKNHKKSHGKTVLTIFLTAIITLAVAFACVFVWVSSDSKYFKLKQMDFFLNDFYGSVSEQDINDGIIRGYLSAMGDKYAGYYTAEENNDRSDRLDGKAMGIGIIVVKHPQNDTIYIKHVYEDAPAQKAGVKEGDEILAIDGVSVVTEGYSVAVDSLLREVGETIDLLLLRDGKKISLSVEYSEFAAQSVFYKMIGDSGYIEIISFNAETVAQLENAVNSLVSSGAKGLIFDLRGNGGGTVESVTQILDFLMPEGTIMTVKYGDGTVEDYAWSDKAHIDLPMAVLVDENTASASELFSATVRDFDKGVLIGTTTYGKGVMQSTFGFTDGSAAVFTIAEFFPHSGQSFNETGLKPDIEVELNEEQDKNFHILTDSEDPVKLAAIEWMNGQ